MEEDKQSQELNNGKEWNSEKVISNKGVKVGNIENEYRNEYNSDQGVIVLMTGNN